MLQPRSLVVTSLFTVFLLLLVGGGWWWFTKPAQPKLAGSQTATLEIANQPITIAVSSTLPNTSVGSLNQTRLEELFAILGFDPALGVVDFDTADRLPVTTIQVVLADITTVPENEQLHFIKTISNQPAEGMTSRYDQATQTMTYSIYIVAPPPETDPNRREVYISEKLVELFFFLQNTPLSPPKYDQLQLQKRSFMPEGATPLLIVNTNTTSQLPKILETLNSTIKQLFIPNPVYAQSCVGPQIECGTQSWEYYCEDGSECQSGSYLCEGNLQPCLQRGACDYGIPVGPNSSCSDFSAPGCGSATGTICSGVNPCFNPGPPWIGSCSNPTNPEEPATPTPTPIPEPGSCGAPCTDNSQCSIPGAQNPACVGGVCWDSLACGSGSPPATCSISLSPSTLNLTRGGAAAQLTAAVSAQNGTIQHVDFEPSNSNISVIPGSDNAAPYQTSIAPVAVGQTTITARGYINGSVHCTATATVDVTFQTTNSDEAPNCVALTSSNSSANQGDAVTFEVELSDSGVNLVPDSGFEAGNNSLYWPNGIGVSEWWSVANALYPNPGAWMGDYYAKIVRATNNPPDSYATA